MKQQEMDRIRFIEPRDSANSNQTTLLVWLLIGAFVTVAGGVSLLVQIAQI